MISCKQILFYVLMFYMFRKTCCKSQQTSYIKKHKPRCWCNHFGTGNGTVHHSRCKPKQPPPMPTCTASTMLSWQAKAGENRRGTEMQQTTKKRCLLNRRALSQECATKPLLFMNLSMEGWCGLMFINIIKWIYQWVGLVHSAGE